jgi:hypothetical protein
VSVGPPGDLSEIGLLPGDGYVDIDRRPASEIARLILQRLGGDEAIVDPKWTGRPARGTTNGRCSPGNDRAMRKRRVGGGGMGGSELR